VVTPPAIVNDMVFVANAAGNVFALSAETGEVLWQDDVKRPVDFQLAIVQRRVYVPTRNGQLFCLETGDAQDDGWAMWGATPEHNGLMASPII
jgi:outer membrane protein assembly factor BamB